MEVSKESCPSDVDTGELSIGHNKLHSYTGSTFSFPGQIIERSTCHFKWPETVNNEYYWCMLLRPHINKKLLDFACDFDHGIFCKIWRPCYTGYLAIWKLWWKQISWPEYIWLARAGYRWLRPCRSPIPAQPMQRKNTRLFSSA